MLADLIFRPVRLEDKPRVLEFTAHTWGEDEDDYIQYVFDDWLNDPRGEFTAAELNGQCVAIAKLTDIGRGEWWFEGLRVDPQARGQGLGEKLNRYQIDLARRLGGQVIRYMTGSENVGSQTIGAKTGFQHIVTYKIHFAPALDEPFTALRLSPGYLLRLIEWLNSPLLQHAQHLIRGDWKVRSFTEAVLWEILVTHEVYGLADESNRITAWCVLRPDDEEELDRLRIDHIDGELDSIAQLARSIRSLAYERGKEKVSASIVNYDPLLSIISQAGYQPHEKHFGMWVMELQL